MRGGSRLLLAAFLWATTLGGCASKSEGEAETPAAAANTPVGLEVENHGWADVVVYLVRGTAEERLGTVGALDEIPRGHARGRYGDANAGGHAQSDNIRLAALIGLNALANSFGDRTGALSGSSRHHHRELFSAEPRAHIEDAN